MHMHYPHSVALAEFDLEEEALRSAHMDLAIEKMASDLAKARPLFPY